MPSKTFKAFLNDNSYEPKLTSKKKAIPYLEDLSSSDFVAALKNLKNCIITEKTDGTSLLFGFDNDGRFFTSRSGKTSDLIVYEAKEYGISGAATVFKAAHEALEQHQEILKEIVKPGEAIDIEILFGRQPNTIVYGLEDFNYIVFLRAVPGTNKKIEPNQSLVEQLASKLKKTTSSVKVIAVDTTDGESLVEGQTITSWKFTAPARIDPKKLDTGILEHKLSDFEKLMKKKNEKASSALGKDVTNGELSNFPLNKAGEAKDEIKQLRDDINQALDSKKQEIRDYLLEKFVRKIRPSLQAKDISSDEDLGIEGLVVLDPKTMNQFKIVDKETFTAVNRFNYQVRNTIYGSVRTDDQAAPITSRGGLLGEMKLRIAALFGSTKLGVTFQAKKYLENFKASSPDKTVKNLAKSLGNVDWLALQGKISLIIDYTETQLQDSLLSFKENEENYSLKLKNGKTIHYTKEVIRRTLLAFAEAKNSLEELKKAIANSNSLTDLIIALYGRLVKKLFGDTPDDGDDLLSEDEGGGTTAGDVGGGPGVTSAGSIASVPVPLFNTKKILKRIIKSNVKLSKKSLKKINTHTLNI